MLTITRFVEIGKLSDITNITELNYLLYAAAIFTAERMRMLKEWREKELNSHFGS